VKIVLPILLILFAAPLSARAKDAAIKIDSISVASKYMFERQAYIQSERPVANVHATWTQSSDFSAYGFAQVGDRGGREVDVGELYSHDLGKVNVHGELSIYMYPSGGKPVYTEAAGVSVLVGPVFIDGDVQHYSGLFTSTLTSVAVRVPLKLAGFSPEVTLGKGFNRPEHLDPWYARISVPLSHSEHAPTLGFRGFWGAGTGVLGELVVHF
jgi:hypothetical protein